MTTGITTTTGVHGDVPPTVLANGSLSTVDYADRFVLRTDAAAGPEQWARAMFGDVPTARALVIWRGVLRLQLSRTPSRDTIAGWQIGGRGQGWIRLEAASTFLSANLLIEASDGLAALSTLVRYDRRRGRMIWTPISAVHRKLVPMILRHGADELRAAESPQH